MALMTTDSLVRQIGSLFDGTSVAAMSDRQLLDRFTSRRDAAGEAAFAAVVRRHGPMVLGVCNEFLKDRHDAEDAFQAVFLVLARKAHSIRDLDLLGNWLYGVTIRTCRHLRHQLVSPSQERGRHALRRCALRASRPCQPSRSFWPANRPSCCTTEIERLPRAFRLPVVLCYLEGLTVHETARRLGCSHGTIRSRMARARAKLRRGLSRRGIVLPAAALAGTLSSRTASASVPPRLCETTAHAAMDFAAGLSVAPLAQEMLRSMLVNKLKLTALSLLLIAAGATGAFGLAPAAAQSQDRKIAPPPAKSPDAGLPIDRTPPPGRMFVTGRVLDPSGKEMPGVPIEIIGHPREPYSAHGGGRRAIPCARARSFRRRWSIRPRGVAHLVYPVL